MEKQIFVKIRFRRNKFCYTYYTIAEDILTRVPIEYVKLIKNKHYIFLQEVDKDLKDRFHKYASETIGDK